ncbi:PEP-CTERM sorting domain-containing protein [Rubritalea squalenifaciens]|nr:PEP-CTERM sorting domain-containing protein [Rubritalea squalenifaciens]
MMQNKTTKGVSALFAVAMMGVTHGAVINLSDSLDNIGAYNVSQDLGVTITGDSAVYVVATMTFDAPLTSSDSFNIIEFGSTAGDTGHAGAGQGFGNTEFVISGAGKTLSGVTITPGVAHLVVLKVDQTTDLATLWIDPNLSLAEVGALQDATRTTGGYSDDISFVKARGGNSNNNTVDYTGISVYYGGDTPFAAIPEPSSSLMLGLCGIGLVLKRRR